MNQRKQDTRSSSSSDSHRYRRPWYWRGLGDSSDSSDLSGGNCGRHSSTGAAGSWTLSHRYLRFPLLPIGSRWLVCRKKTGYTLKTKTQEEVFGCENPLWIFRIWSISGFKSSKLKTKCCIFWNPSPTLLLHSMRSASVYRKRDSKLNFLIVTHPRVTK